MLGWHADIDDRHVGPGRTNQREQFDPVPDLTHHLEPRTVEQAGEALT
jgi:hypothetical protein